jgi:hypothetical protein
MSSSPTAHRPVDVRPIADAAAKERSVIEKWREYLDSLDLVPKLQLRTRTSKL